MWVWKKPKGEGARVRGERRMREMSLTPVEGSLLPSGFGRMGRELYSLTPRSEALYLLWKGRERQGEILSIYFS